MEVSTAGKAINGGVSTNWPTLFSVVPYQRQVEKGSRVIKVEAMDGTPNFLMGELVELADFGFINDN